VLELPHRVDGISQLLLDELDFSGAVEPDGALNKARVERFGAGDFLGVGGIDLDQQMEVSVADMPKLRFVGARISVS
jgi:hypothetical protein